MPKKAKSKAQMKFFGAVKGGVIKKKGLSAKKAGEMVKGSKAKNLPAKVKGKSKKVDSNKKFENARKKHFGMK